MRKYLNLSQGCKVLCQFIPSLKAWVFLARIIIIASLIVVLLVTTFVVAKTKIKVSKEKEDKIKEFIWVDLPDVTVIEVNDITIDGDIIFLNTTTDGKKMLIITTNSKTNTKILKHNPNSTNLSDLTKEDKE